ncbi:MAG: 2-oxo acid dehydrogenase subunit E2 [Proteobacteria bacterium]|nr:2-oxo acid dehydrogenase subunit E2 [Pseudomonadota bacterium]
MKRLTRREIGPARSEIMDLMARAPDPYASLNYQIDIGPCRQWIKAAESANRRHILLTPVLIKLIAHAIEENPRFNQIVFGSSLYQLENIHIANLVYIAEGEIVTNIIMKNPHQKSLHDVQQELFAEIAQAKIKFSSPPHPLVSFLTGLCYRYCLYRIIGPLRSFKTIYERDLISNIILSVHTYATPANFTMVKDVITTLNFTPRIHASGPFQKPVLDNGMLVIRDILELHITTDHRIINGFDSYHFGMSLEQIAANPEKYFT